MADLVIVVDMQRGFLEEGNPLYRGDEARRIIPHVQRLLDEQLKKGVHSDIHRRHQGHRGQARAKRGRIPGETHNPRLKTVDLTPYTKA